ERHMPPKCWPLAANPRDVPGGRGKRNGRPRPGALPGGPGDRVRSTRLRDDPAKRGFREGRRDRPRWDSIRSNPISGRRRPRLRGGLPKGDYGPPAGGTDPRTRRGGPDFQDLAEAATGKWPRRRRCSVMREDDGDWFRE